MALHWHHSNKNRAHLTVTFMRRRNLSLLREFLKFFPLIFYNLSDYKYICISLLQKGFLNARNGSIQDSEEDSNTEELDQPIDFQDLPTRIDWKARLPANIVVPRVEIHSLVLDFAAVSFLDISGLKGLKTVRDCVSNDQNIYSLLPAFLCYIQLFCFLQLLKELIRVEIEVYIVACDRKYKTPITTHCNSIFINYNTVITITFKTQILLEMHHHQLKKPRKRRR